MFSRKTIYQCFAPLGQIVVTGVLTHAAVAQESVPVQAGSNSNTLEEIIVTARRREESLQSTPVAVSAVSAEEIRNINANTIGDIAAVVPGLDKREGRKQGGFAIRGVGQQRIDAVDNDPGVGVYVDGIFLPRDDSQLIDAVSVQMVQVLRGPQGTLFGKNTVGGTILVTTEDPAEEFTATINTKVDTFGRRDLSLSFDVPFIADKLHTRLTVAQVKSDGYVEDVDTGKSFGSDDRKLLLLQALANLSESLQLKLMGYYNDQHELSAPTNCEVVNPAAPLMGFRAPGNPDNYRTVCTRVQSLIKRQKVQHENVGLNFTSEDLLLGATLSWQLPFGEFKSISSYIKKGPNTNDFNFDGTDLMTIGNNQVAVNGLVERGFAKRDAAYRRSWGQEFQFSGDALDGKLNYTTGLFASSEIMAKQVGGIFLTPSGWIGLDEIPGLAIPDGFVAVVAVTAGATPTFENNSYAVFGQAIFDLGDAVQLTAGARYSFEMREIATDLVQQSRSVPEPYPAELPIVVVTEQEFNNLENVPVPMEFSRRDEAEETFKRFSPMLSLGWDLTEQFGLTVFDHLMTYLTISEGFKAGGFAGLAEGYRTFDPEVVLSKEVGIKMDALDRRLRINMAAYHSDYTDIQLLITRANSAGAIEPTTTNAGEAVIQGFEFETTLLLTQKLTLAASGNYIDADFIIYDDFQAINDDPTQPTTYRNLEADRSDEPFPHIPETTYSLSMRYYLPTDFLGDFNFIVTGNYRDKLYMGQDPLSYQPQFSNQAFTDEVTLFSLRATWIPYSDQSLQLSLFGNNITDEQYIASGVTLAGSFGVSSLTPGKGANWGMELRYEFR